MYFGYLAQDIGVPASIAMIDNPAHMTFWEWSPPILCWQNCVMPCHSINLWITAINLWITASPQFFHKIDFFSLSYHLFSFLFLFASRLYLVSECSLLLLLLLPDYGNFVDIFFLFRADERSVWDLFSYYFILEPDLTQWLGISTVNWREIVCLGNICTGTMKGFIVLLINVILDDLEQLPKARHYSQHWHSVSTVVDHSMLQDLQCDIG